MFHLERRIDWRRFRHQSSASGRCQYQRWLPGPVCRYQGDPAYRAISHHLFHMGEWQAGVYHWRGKEITLELIHPGCLYRRREQWTNALHYNFYPTGIRDCYPCLKYINRSAIWHFLAFNLLDLSKLYINVEHCHTNLIHLSFTETIW